MIPIIHKHPNFFHEWQKDFLTLPIAEQERLLRVQAISAFSM
ncbi:hypothetical protein V2H45_09880 [Tumidithrix elongata RA019]|uniref:Uncharacterized protein n=1 Tax=Tumidithrix elongata BACA0141 TaxID=2716417 RepID=A0AAW9PR34_9CYAN|nr:hypothetical protein [Tumidithrix elongata RA019]